MVQTHIKTYGCTLNQADSDLMAGMLEGSGIGIGDAASSDVVIVNTCTVKTPTEQKILHRLAELEKAGRRVVVTGCMASANRDAIEKYAPSASIVTTGNIERIVEVVEGAAAGRRTVISGYTGNDKLELFRGSGGLIAKVPVSEGCLSVCSFCETKFARGPLNSFSEDRIVRAVGISAGMGAKEIQLTSQDMGAYGADMGTDIAKLMARLSALAGDFRIRVGMLNPEHLGKYLDGFIDAMRSERFYKFVHLPIQSGSDRVLRDMRRRYTVADFDSYVTALRKAIPSITVETDVIVGYPTETEEDFMQTLDFVRRTRPNVVNMCRFWTRPHAGASRLKQLGAEEIAGRSGELGRVVRRMQKELNEKFIGERINVLITEVEKGTLFGRTPTYKKVVIKKSAGLGIGSRAEVRITGVSCNVLYGEQIKMLNNVGGSPTPFMGGMRANRRTTSDINTNGDKNNMDSTRAYKFRLCPDAKRQSEIELQLALSKGFYNLLLENSIKAYKEGNKKLSMATLNRFAKEIEKDKKYLNIYSQARCEIKYRILKAYQNFFRRCKEKKNGNRVKAGFPRFKSRDRYYSIVYPQDNGSFAIERERKVNMLRASRIGRMTIDLHRNIEGRIKTLTIKKEAGNYYAIFTTINEIEPPAIKDTNPVGMDMGLNSFIVLSDGTKVEKPRFVTESEKHIAKWQRIIARREKGSKRMERAKERLSRKWEHATNQSNDFAHKLSDKLVNSGYTSFAVEKLNIQSMVKNHNLAQSIHNASWNRFIQMLSYKAESAGMEVIRVDARNTTKECSNCGSMMNMPLSVREYSCNRCGLRLDRDINASINILKRGRAGLARTDAQGDNHLCVPTGDASGVVELRTYPAIAGEAHGL